MSFGACADELPAADTGVIAAPDAGEPDSGPDAGPILPPPVGPCNPVVMPTPGSGTSGGMIQGMLSVFAEDPATGTLFDAFVRVELPGDQVMEGKTTNLGCVQFSGPEVRGPVTVHVFAAGRVYQTWKAVDAAVLTFSLPTATVIGTGRPTAHVLGRVTSLSTLTTTTATIARAGIILPILRSVFGDIPRQLTRIEDPDVPVNLFVLGAFGFAFRDYAVFVDPRDTKGVWVNAGVIRFPTPNSSLFELSRIGVMPGLSFEPGEERTEVNFPITHTKDRILAVDFANPPPLPAFLAVPLVFLPNNGGVMLLDRTVDTLTPIPIPFRVPALTGVLEGGHYGAYIQLSNGNHDAYSSIVAHGNDTLAIDAGSMPDMPMNLRVQGRTVSALVDARCPAVTMLFTVNQVPRWRMLSFGDITPSVTFPEVPEGLEDPLDGLVGVDITAALYDSFDPDMAVFDHHLDERIRLLAGTAANLTFE